MLVYCVTVERPGLFVLFKLSCHPGLAVPMPTLIFEALKPAGGFRRKKPNWAFSESIWAVF